MARYEANSTAEGEYSILDKKRGKYVLVGESYTVCSQVCHHLNGELGFDGEYTEAMEVADSIRNGGK